MAQHEALWLVAENIIHRSCFVYRGRLLPGSGWWTPETHFSKALGTFQPCKAIFNSSVSKNREVYMPETSCTKRTSVHIKNMWINPLCNQKVQDFSMAFREQKIFRTLKRPAPGHHSFKDEFERKILIKSNFSL